MQRYTIVIVPESLTVKDQGGKEVAWLLRQWGDGLELGDLIDVANLFIGSEFYGNESIIGFVGGRKEERKGFFEYFTLVQNPVQEDPTTLLPPEHLIPVEDDWFSAISH